MPQIRHFLALSLCACSLNAAAQMLQNSGFESAAVADGTGAFGVAAAWGSGQLVNPDVTGSAVVGTVTYTGLPQAFAGEQYANLGVWIATGIEQSFVVTEPGLYAVSWADNSAFFAGLQAQASYQVSLLQGSQFVSFPFDAYHQGEWREHQTSAFLTPGVWTLRFEATRVIGAPTAVALVDDVRISPVPEPAAGALLALGLAVLAWRRRGAEAQPR